MQPPPSTNPTGDLDIIRQAIDWYSDGHGVVLATVIETWGSAPRPVGSQVVVNDQSAFTGSVSGGCIEGEVVTEALGLMRNGGWRILEFNVSDETASGAGLACGGKVKVLVSPVTEDLKNFLDDLLRTSDQKIPVALAFDLEIGNPGITKPSPRDRSGINDGTFIRVYSPPLRLLIIGAVHIGQALANLGIQADYDVTVIDPRDTWGTAERFPGIEIDRRWPSAAIEDLAPDRATAVVTLSHDPKLDDPVFIETLKTDAFYIGALGSRGTHAKRVARLKEQDVSDDALERIHAPVGLDIGANTPFEIALSIMGQIITAHRQRPE